MPRRFGTTNIADRRRRDVARRKLKVKRRKREQEVARLESIRTKKTPLSV